MGPIRVPLHNDPGSRNATIRYLARSKSTVKLFRFNDARSRILQMPTFHDGPQTPTNRNEPALYFTLRAEQSDPVLCCQIEGEDPVYQVHFLDQCFRTRFDNFRVFEKVDGL